MTTLLAWESADSCPDCGTGWCCLMTAPPGPAECGSCGYSEVWAVTVPAGGGDR